MQVTLLDRLSSLADTTNVLVGLFSADLTSKMFTKPIRLPVNIYWGNVINFDWSPVTAVGSISHLFLIYERYTCHGTAVDMFELSRHFAVAGQDVQTTMETNFVNNI